MGSEANRHSHPHGAGAWRGTDRRALAMAAALTGGFMLVEVAGGIAFNSLALLADAGHMVSDTFSLVLALGAVTLAARPATSKRTFGYRRAEILAALVNGVLLVVVSAWITVEAVRRLSEPVEVLGGGMLAVACAGLLVNGVSAWVLIRSDGGSLNVRAALRHVLGDLAGSVGAIFAALTILLTGWEAADAVASILISVLIALSAWSILRESVDVLLEGTPSGLDSETVGNAMASVAGVEQVHDLHVWQITSGFPSLSAHVLVAPEADCHGIRRDVEQMLQERFEITHTTLQVEHRASTGPLRIEPMSR